MAKAMTIPFDDLSNKHTKMVALAREEAEKSDMFYRHGSLAVSNGRVLAKGRNKYRNKLRNRYVCSFHSEVDVMSTVFRGTCQPSHRTTNPRFEGCCLQGPKVAKAA